MHLTQWLEQGWTCEVSITLDEQHLLKPSKLTDLYEVTINKGTETKKEKRTAGAHRQEHRWKVTILVFNWSSALEYLHAHIAQSRRKQAAAHRQKYTRVATIR